MATISGYWDRYEPRPPEHEITADLTDFCIWLAGVSRSLDAEEVRQTMQFAGVQAVHCRWPQGAVLRTPEERFAGLASFPYAPKYAEIEGLRMAYVEEGAGDPILLVHGGLAWGYEYRRVIPALARLGRVIAPDLIGFGRSDKPAAANAHSYKSHARWLAGFVEALNLSRVTLICTDWGGALALRLLATHPLPFLRVAALNTDLPDGSGAAPAWLDWRKQSQSFEALDVPGIVRGGLRRSKLSDADAAAYAAPFPGKEYQTAPRVVPRLWPVRPDEPAAYDNRVAIELLRGGKTPNFLVLLLWAGNDTLTAAGEPHLRSIFLTVAPPVTIPGAGHFILEDAADEVMQAISDWMKAKTMYGQIRW